MNTLNIGDKMPSFECLDENENILKSEDFIGKKQLFSFTQEQIRQVVLLKHVIFQKIIIN